MARVQCHHSIVPPEGFEPSQPLRHLIYSQAQLLQRWRGDLFKFGTDLSSLPSLETGRDIFLAVVANDSHHHNKRQTQGYHTQRYPQRVVHRLPPLTL